MQMLKWAGRPQENERGAVAILVAASLMMLMGFAAMTVDVGAAFGERRQDQSASDMAAMVAVQFARGSSNPATAADNGATQAIAVANSSLDNPPTIAEWGSCVDPNRPAEYTRVSGVSDCVSFTNNLQKARVVIPTIEVPTTFGRVMGKNSIATTAFAEAQGDVAQEGTVLPFGLPGGSAGNTEVCLRTNNNTPAPCDGPEQGNFGTLDFAIYGTSSITIENCNPNPQHALETNMVAGVDHPLGTVDGDVREDADYCPIFNARPNHVEGQTGIGSALLSGIVTGTSHYLTGYQPGRLARGGNRISVDSTSPDLDNTPLWSYIDGGSAKPASCGSVGDTAGMAQCVADWRSGSYTDPLFTISIGSAVRFGAVPQLTAAAWGSGTQLYGIADVVPVYIQGTFWKCTGAGTCEVIHYPGDPAASSGVGNEVTGANRLNGISAFILDIDMLPEPLRSDFPTTAEQVDYALVK
jgi:Flp pilus assembly protein TadG